MLKERHPEIKKAHNILLDVDKYSNIEVEEARALIEKDQADVKALLDTID